MPQVKKGLKKVHFFEDDCTYKNPAAGCRKHKLSESWQTEGISCSFVLSLTNSLMYPFNDTKEKINQIPRPERYVRLCTEQ